MPADLAAQIRELTDATPPVTATEAIRRAEQNSARLATTTMAAPNPPSRWSPRLPRRPAAAPLSPAPRSRLPHQPAAAPVPPPPPSRLRRHPVAAPLSLTSRPRLPRRPLAAAATATVLVAGAALAWELTTAGPAATPRPPAPSRAATPGGAAAGSTAPGGTAPGAAQPSGSTEESTSAAGSTGPHQPPGNRTAPRARAVLTAATVDRIVVSSTSATASSGTAEVTETSWQRGLQQSGNTAVPSSSDSVAVTFEGANIDEKITVEPEPPGSAKAFTTDDRLVDGQFYIYTPGPDGVAEWMHDTDSADDLASMQVPGPRTLDQALDAGAHFEVAGTSTSGGTTLTRLVALDPGAIETSALGNLAAGALTSFEMWIDPSDVVQQMAFTSSVTVHACTLQHPAGARITGGNLQDANAAQASQPTSPPQTASLPALHATGNSLGAAPVCGLLTTISKVTVAFADLGAPETVTAPTGAVDFQGKG